MTRDEASLVLRKFYADGYKSDNYDEVELALQTAVIALESHETPKNYDGKAMLYVNQKSSELAYKRAIEDACEWLRNADLKDATKTTKCVYNMTDFSMTKLKEEFIEQFKKAMLQ